MAAPLTVLLFEDDEGQALLTREALEQEGCVVEVARTGREGLERVLAKDYDVHLIDIVLPDLQGVEVLRRIHTMKPRAVSIIVTGHGDETMAVNAMRLGASDYVVKSSSMGHLTTLPVVIREAIERHRLKAEREALQEEVWEHARLLEERNVELRRANEELKRVDQLKSDLVSMVSHELRTPLATIKEFAAILADQLAGPISAKQREQLQIIQANVERLARMIDNLLDMAKLDAGQIFLAKSFISVGPLIDQVRQTLRPLAESKQITLTAQVSSGLPEAFADVDKMTQVLINLVGNAIKFTDGPGQVTISVAERQNELEFSIADTGVGIAADDLPKLFKEFQQLTQVRGERTKGIGLGLAISKRFVELHGGRIWATSMPGRGSTFLFTLPKYHVEEAFRDYLKTGVEQAARKQTALSVIAVALPQFAEFKTLYGPEEASRLLKDVEMLLRDVVRRRSGDLVIRWQRGEVIAVLAEVNLAGAQAIAERVLQAVAGRALTIGGRSLKVALATATATYPQEAQTAEALLQLLESRLPNVASAKTRVLVVDDEPKVRQLLKEALELQEYEVLVAASGPDALEQAKRQPVDLVLLDLLMPVMDGYEVYHLLKENPQTKDVPVIIVTAKGERKDRLLGLEASTYNYIAKPFQLDELIAKVRDVLLQRHLSHS